MNTTPVRLTEAERYICLHGGKSYPRDAIEVLATEFLGNVKDIKPPVRLIPFLYKRRIVDVQMSNGLGRGGLIVNEDGFIITINKNQSTSAQRFAFAHELAHTFFYDLTTCPPEYVGERSQSEMNQVELLCDHGANCLLLPHQLVSKSLSIHNPTSLIGLNNLAKCFCVSFTSICIAVGRVGFWDKSKTSVIVIAEDSNSDSSKLVRDWRTEYSYISKDCKRKIGLEYQDDFLKALSSDLVKKSVLEKKRTQNQDRFCWKEFSFITKIESTMSNEYRRHVAFLKIDSSVS